MFTSTASVGSYADAAHDLRLQPTSSAARPAVAVFDCDDRDAELLRQLAPQFGVRPIITSAPISEASVELATGVRSISISHKARVTRPILRALHRIGVRYLSTRSIGYDHIDTHSAQEAGIVVENVSYSPDSVADYTVMLMLMAIRNAKVTIRRVDANDYRLPDHRGRELRDLTVGVIGTGRIGRAVITRLSAFGCRILAYDRHPTHQATDISLAELLRQSDIVTLHTPLNSDTYHLIDGHRMKQLKPGAVLINTGRGALLDTTALIRALESGALSAAALDVIEGEEGIFSTDCGETVIGNPALVRLAHMPNVLITPHTAYYTEHALSDMFVGSITNCLRFETGFETGSENGAA